MTPLAMVDVAPRTRTWLGRFLRGLATGRDPLPECRVEGGVDISREVLPLRVEGLELFGSHARVFGGIHAATVLLRDTCEALEQVEAHVVAKGEIERERDAGRGEGKHSRRWHVAKDLDDGEK